MKKILLAFDGTNFSQGAFEFARRLNELQPVLLTGAFIPQVNFSASWSYATGEGPLYIPSVEPAVSEKVAENILRFESLCKQHHIDYRVHKHFHNLGLPELKKESRFADLLILGNEKFFEHQSISYLLDMLHDSECPVLAVPEQFSFPEHIILAYDGSAAAAFAMKQFACLFPELCNLTTTLVYAGNEAEPSVPDQDYIEELAARHFSNLDILKLEINPGREFATWLSGVRAPLLITGSFGRSLFSQAFRQSFSEAIVSNHVIPAFIAHK